MQTTTDASLFEKITQARERLDEHVRQLVKWHFRPETGCPFWLEFKESCGFDPRWVSKLVKYGRLQELDAWK